MNSTETMLHWDRATRFVASLTWMCGTLGMGISFLFLTSANQHDVIAGAAGFVAGSILTASGLVSISVLSPARKVSAARLRESARSAVLSQPLDAQRWKGHFERNRRNRPEPDWNAPITLSAELVSPLVRSLEQFQLGDGGGPACLIAWNADKFRLSSEATRELVDLWFAEEREHSRLLKSAVDRFGGRCIDGHWSFSAFCLSRKALGVQFELTVLLLTEIASTTYYRLLARYGEDPALKSMCRLILRDEAGHVAFHRDRLARRGRISASRYGIWWEIRFRALGLGAATMLWINHGRSLRALGATGEEFYREVWNHLTRFLHALRREVTR